MARTVDKVDAARVKAEANPERKDKDRLAVRGKGSHAHQAQGSPRAPARVEARDKAKVRVNPSLHPVQADSHEQVEIALPAQAMSPAMFSSP